MAGETDKSQKTEDPTQRKLDEARKKGDVAKSTEIAGVLVLSCAGLMAATLAAPGAEDLTLRLSPFVAAPHEMSADPAGLMATARQVAGIGALALMLPFAILSVAALVGHVGQTGFLASPEKLKPKLSKLSPLAGAKRMFGPEAAANFGKGVGKMALVAAACTVALWPRRDQLLALHFHDAAAMMAWAREAIVALLLASVVVYAPLAIIDYLGQRRAFTARQRMSRQEVKDEHKQSEGDPHVKARLRQLRMERARRRMMAAVPNATVVVMNPTHYAVALKYEQGETPAPICVAKGVDAMALKIRDLAKEHRVPVIEDPPLARALYAGVELDAPIPTEHYAAVAKLIGYVLGLARRPGRA